MTVRLPLLALVGRPNVGKSTLFNRLLGRRRAIVDERPGTTRDPVEGIVRRTTPDGAPQPFRLLDTGGLGLDPARWEEKGGTAAPKRAAELVRAVEEEVWIAAGAADRILLVVDVREGIQPLDIEIAERLRKSGKPWIVAANKVEGAAANLGAAEFHRLGVEVLSISAEHGTGIEELLDAATQGFPTAAGGKEEVPLLKLAVVGRPNVGKSSLWNQLLGHSRTAHPSGGAIVSEIPGTTRDLREQVLETPEGKILLLDTAGVRRGRALGEVERVTRILTERALAEADVAAVLIDADVGLAQDDRRMLEHCLAAGAGVLLVLNKWDLVAKARGDFQEPLRRALGTAGHVPFVATSALTGRGLEALLREAMKIGDRRRKRIPTGQLNRVLAAMREDLPSGFRPKYITQFQTAPPRFLLFGRGRCPQVLIRRIEHLLRATEDFAGVPLSVEFRPAAGRSAANRPAASRPAWKKRT